MLFKFLNSKWWTISQKFCAILLTLVLLVCYMFGLSFGLTLIMCSPLMFISTLTILSVEVKRALYNYVSRNAQ